MNGSARRKHGRRRGTVRILAGVALILTGLAAAGLWVASGWYRLRWNGDLWVLRAARGQLFVYRGMTTEVPDVARWPGSRWTSGRVDAAADKTRFDWWAAPERFPPLFDQDKFDTRGWDMRIVAFAEDVAAARNTNPRWTYPRCWAVALWPLPLPLVGAGVWVGWLGWRARRRQKRGACPKCGYLLTGIGAAVCPECGETAK